MSTFAVNLTGHVYVPVIAEDFQFTTENQRVSGSQPIPPRIQCLTFINYNGVDLTRFIEEVTGPTPPPQIVEPDYWIPAKNVYTVHKLFTDAVTPTAPPLGATRNIYMVIPLAVNYFIPFTLEAGTKMEAFPLFAADSFHFGAKSRLHDRRNKAQGVMGGAEVVLIFTNYRGRVQLSQLSTPGPLPPIIPELDFYLPIKYVAAVFRIRSQLWI